MPMAMQCPFFKRDNNLILYCEGAKLMFPDTDARSEFVLGYCETIITGESARLHIVLKIIISESKELTYAEHNTHYSRGVVGDVYEEHC